jgi:class 3 adenylate cyclase
MGLKADLESDVGSIFRDQWSHRGGREVPSDASLKLGNDAVKISATVLYADLADSTQLVDTYTWMFASEIYKTFLLCAAKVIRSEDGVITAYDGDRIMGVFIGDTKNTSAMRAAMKINWAVRKIITPAQKCIYSDKDYVIRHVVGIDTSELFIAKTGVRGANDLVWVGRAANHAAKLAALAHTHSSRVTEPVYKAAADSVKSGAGRNYWERVKWTDHGERYIYRTNEDWPIG